MCTRTESGIHVVTQHDPESITVAPAPPKGTLNGARWHEILDAAGEVFQEKGYQAARIEDIANRVGILKGSLYYYIETKEDLLYALSVAGHSTGLATLDEDDATRAADAPARIGAFIERWMATIPSTPQYARVTERDVRLLTDQRRAAVMEMRNQMHQYVRKIVEQGIAEGHFDPTTDPGVATNSIFELLNSTSRWFRPTGRLSHDALGAFYKKLIVQGLRPEATS